MGRYVADVTGLFPRCFATGTTWHPSAHPPTATAPQVSASSVVAPPDVAAAADAGIGVTARHAADGLALVTATAAAPAAGAAAPTAEPAAPLPLLPRLESEAFQFRGTGVFSRKAVTPVTVAAGVTALPDAWAAEQRQALTIQWRELPPLSAVRIIGAPAAAPSAPGAPAHVASATKEQLDELVIARRAARRASRQLSRNYKAAHATAHGVTAAAATASRGGSPARADEAGSGSERHSAHAPASSSNQAPREGGSGADDEDAGEDKKQSMGPLASPPLMSSSADAFLGSPLSLAKGGSGGSDPRVPTANDRNDTTWYLVGTVEWAEALAQVGGGQWGGQDQHD